MITAFSNLIPLAGLLFFDWNAVSFFFMYWCEGLIIFFVSFFRMRRAGISVKKKLPTLPNDAPKEHHQKKEYFQNKHFWGNAIAVYFFVSFWLFMGFGAILMILDKASSRPVGIDTAPALGFGLWLDVLRPALSADKWGIIAGVASLFVGHVYTYFKTRSALDKKPHEWNTPIIMYSVINMPLLMLATLGPSFVLILFLLAKTLLDLRIFWMEKKRGVV